MAPVTPKRTRRLVLFLVAGGILAFLALLLVGLVGYWAWTSAVARTPTTTPLLAGITATQGPALEFQGPDPIAHLAILRGLVEVRANAQSAWQVAANGQAVPAGSAIHTASGARVQLVFADGPVAELGENTELSLEQAGLRTGEPALIRLVLYNGDTWHRLDSKGQAIQYEVRTPSALVVMQGTLVHIVTTANVETQVEVSEGAATIIAAGQSLPLAAGQGARVAAGQAPMLAARNAADPAPPAASAEADTCQYNAHFSGDITIPPGTAVEPGQRLEKIWRMRNTGQCAWLDYTWAFISGDLPGEVPAVRVPRTEPGGTVDISVTFSAPTAAGAYSGLWRLKDQAGQGIGQPAALQFVVSVPTATVATTRTLTATPPGTR